jgi:predicted nucleic acid-binding protein
LAINQVAVVIDASLAINLVLTFQPYHSQARRLAQSWVTNNIQLLAPPLYESEADGVILRYFRRGNISLEVARAAQQLLDALPVNIVQDARVRLRAREIASEFNQNLVYDATYVALAEISGCDFWTADKEFYEAVREGLPYVKFVGDYN